jgi:hypothetical protein
VRLVQAFVYVACLAAAEQPQDAVGADVVAAKISHRLSNALMGGVGQRSIQAGPGRNTTV